MAKMHWPVPFNIARRSPPCLNPNVAEWVDPLARKVRTKNNGVAVTARLRHHEAN